MQFEPEITFKIATTTTKIKSETTWDCFTTSWLFCRQLGFSINGFRSKSCYFGEHEIRVQPSKGRQSLFLDISYWHHAQSQGSELPLPLHRAWAEVWVRTWLCSMAGTFASTPWKHNPSQGKDIRLHWARQSLNKRLMGRGFMVTPKAVVQLPTRTQLEAGWPT